jgi:hypothetical protein
MEGCPRAQLVVELKTPTVALDTTAEEFYDKNSNCGNRGGLEVTNSGEKSDTDPLLHVGLHEKLSVLFVDDNSMIESCLPSWFVRPYRNRCLSKRPLTGKRLSGSPPSRA